MSAEQDRDDAISSDGESGEVGNDNNVHVSGTPDSASSSPSSASSSTANSSVFTTPVLACTAVTVIHHVQPSEPEVAVASPAEATVVVPSSSAALSHSTGVIVRRPPQQPNNRLLLSRLTSGSRRQEIAQTRALDLRVPSGENSPFTNGTAFSSTGMGCCWKCGELCNGFNSTGPQFCHDHCLTTFYQREHVVRRDICFRCGRPGDWSVSRDENLDLMSMDDNPYRLCQPCRNSSTQNSQQANNFAPMQNFNQNVTLATPSHYVSVSHPHIQQYFGHSQQMPPECPPRPAPQSTPGLFHQHSSSGTARSTGSGNFNAETWQSCRYSTSTGIVNSVAPSGDQSQPTYCYLSPQSLIVAPPSQPSYTLLTTGAASDNQISWVTVNSSLPVAQDRRQTNSNLSRTLNNQQTTTATPTYSSLNALLATAPQHSEVQLQLEQITLQRGSPTPPPVRESQIVQEQNFSLVRPHTPMSAQAAAIMAAANTLVTMTIPRSSDRAQRRRSREAVMDIGEARESTPSPAVIMAPAAPLVSPQPHVSAFAVVRGPSRSGLRLSTVANTMPTMSSPMGPQLQPTQQHNAQQPGPMDRSTGPRPHFNHHQQLLQQHLLGTVPPPPPRTPQIQIHSRQEHFNAHNLQNNDASNLQPTCAFRKRLRLENSGGSVLVGEETQGPNSGHPELPRSPAQPSNPPYNQFSPQSGFQQHQRMMFSHPPQFMEGHVVQPTQQQIPHPPLATLRPMSCQWLAWRNNSDSLNARYSPGGAIGTNGHSNTMSQTMTSDGYQYPEGENTFSGEDGSSQRPARRNPPAPFYIPHTSRTHNMQIQPRNAPSATVTSASLAADAESSFQQHQVSGGTGQLLRAGPPTLIDESILTGANATGTNGGIESSQQMVRSNITSRRASTMSHGSLSTSSSEGTVPESLMFGMGGVANGYRYSAEHEIAKIEQETTKARGRGSRGRVGRPRKQQSESTRGRKSQSSSTSGKSRGRGKRGGRGGTSPNEATNAGERAFALANSRGRLILNQNDSSTSYPETRQAIPSNNNMPFFNHATNTTNVVAQSPRLLSRLQDLPASQMHNMRQLDVRRSPTPSASFNLGDINRGQTFTYTKKEQSPSKETHSSDTDVEIEQALRLSRIENRQCPHRSSDNMKPGKPPVDQQKVVPITTSASMTVSIVPSPAYYPNVATQFPHLHQALGSKRLVQNSGASLTPSTQPSSSPYTLQIAARPISFPFTQTHSSSLPLASYSRGAPAINTEISSVPSANENPERPSLFLTSGFMSSSQHEESSPIDIVGSEVEIYEEGYYQSQERLQQNNQHIGNDEESDDEHEFGQLIIAEDIPASDDIESDINQGIMGEEIESQNPDTATK